MTAHAELGWSYPAAGHYRPALGVSDFWSRSCLGPEHRTLAAPAVENKTKLLLYAPVEDPC